MLFRLTAGTNVGLVRSNNEDNFIVNADLSSGEWYLPEKEDGSLELGESGCVFCVADGMGGMNAGEVASSIAVDTVKREFSEADLKKVAKSAPSIEKFLAQTVEKADQAIKDKVKEESSTSGMGTTIVVAWVLDKNLHVVWCGDSRAYLFNPESGLVRLSKDHSYVQQLVDDGKLDKELAFDHPDSNIITRSLGDCSSKAIPDYISRVLAPGDIILLCSDGLCGLCRDEEILQVMANNTTDEWSVGQLKNSLIRAALDAGGYDNVTVALFVNDSEPDENDIPSSTTNDAGKAGSRKKTHRLVMAVAIVLIVAAIVTAICLLCPGIVEKVSGWASASWGKLLDFIQSTIGKLKQ